MNGRRSVAWIVGACCFALLIPSSLARDLTRTSPERAGMSSERLERLESKMRAYVDDGHVPGIVTMIARKGKVVHSLAYGVLDVEKDTPVQEDSLFRIYSMSKPITSVALMMLYEEGKFHLRDPVRRYLPEFKDTKVLVDGEEVEQEHPFTVRELLTHTAGLTYGVFGNTPVDRQYRKAKILGNKDLAEMSELLAKIPLQYQPGSRWHYSVSADLAGRLVEVLSGQPFDVFLKERLFEPLKMHDTFFEVPEDKIDRFGTNHMRRGGEVTVIDRPSNSQFVGDVTFFSGGGGLVSTAPNYLRFAQMLLNGGELDGERVLSRKTVELMRINHLAEGMGAGRGETPNMSNRRFGFGLGFGVVVDLPSSQMIGSVGSYSWGGAAGTIFWVDPVEELVAVGMIQHMAFRRPFRADLQVLTYQAIVD